MSIVYSKKTVRELAGLGEQQFRNWKRVVLKGLPVARANKFTLPQMTTVLILSDLVNRIGLQVRHAADYAGAILDLCEANALDELGACSLVLRVGVGDAFLRPNDAKAGGGTEVVIALEGVIAPLRAAVLHGGAQLTLSLSAPRSKADLSASHHDGRPAPATADKQ